MYPLVGVAGIAFLAIAVTWVLLGMLHSSTYWLRSWLGSVFSAMQNTPPGAALTKIWHFIEPGLLAAFPGTLALKYTAARLIDATKHIERFVLAKIGSAASAQLPQLTRLFRATDAIIAQEALHIKGVAFATYQALAHLTQHTIPDIARDIVHPVEVVAVHAQALATEAEARLTDFRNALLGALAAAGIGTFQTLSAGINAFVKAFENLHTEVWQTIKPWITTMQTVVLPGIQGGLTDLEREIFQGIPGTLGELRQWAHDLADFAKNALRDPIAWWLGLFGSAAGLLGLEAVMTKIAPDLFCKNTKGVTKALCGMDEALLASILTGALGLLVVLDPVAIAKTALAAEDVMDSVIRQTAS